MKQIVFRCSEIMNHYEEVFEFEDDATEEDINAEFSEWVWNEVGDRFSWFEKPNHDAGE
jgi:hypothetical protein